MRQAAVQWLMDCEIQEHRLVAFRNLGWGSVQEPLTRIVVRAWIRTDAGSSEPFCFDNAACSLHKGQSSDQCGHPQEPHCCKEWFINLRNDGMVISYAME
jgi:hypothetical protein